MFPDKALWDRYIARAVQKLPRRGDISARSALTIHRGTANRSDEARPVLVVAADAPDGINANHHDLQVTRAYLDSLPAQVRDHLTYRVTDELEPVHSASCDRRPARRRLRITETIDCGAPSGGAGNRPGLRVPRDRP